MTKLICEICGKEFIAYGKQAKIRRRCSLACYTVHLKNKYAKEKQKWYNPSLPIVPCDTCGKSIRLNDGKVQRNIPHHFCSRKCYYTFRSKEYRGEKHPQWRGGISYYRGSDWKCLRDEVRRRANYTCQHCGQHESEFKEHLHAHHNIPFYCFVSLKHANKLSNLIALCRSCHMKAEKKLKHLPRFIPLPFGGGNHDPYLKLIFPPRGLRT